MQQVNLTPLLSFELFLAWLSTLKSILQPTKMPVTSPGRRCHSSGRAGRMKPR